MNDALANLVQPVLARGLALLERLRQGGTPALETEQAALRELLQPELAAQMVTDYGGTARERPDERGGEPFLGVRYALTCWLDELFVLDSPWENEWNERKLEMQLYGTNDRAWRFWQQARLAESRPTSDALEGFYLCVMLGFRGQLRETPDQVQAWSGAVLRRLVTRGDWRPPADLKPTRQVPPLRGAERLRRVFYLLTLVVLLLVPLAAFLLVQRLSE